MTKIVMDDLRTAGVGTCKSSKSWMKRNGFDWRDLRRDVGVDADRVRHMTSDNAFVERVIRAAEEREARGQ